MMSQREDIKNRKKKKERIEQSYKHIKSFSKKIL